ncbi:hypothetical protein ZIOFF_014040 [Zingiber officinale]|uniref:RRM domain-containing protein n=1 Tax=Zingiber officinale TaxID=94328 RepID=A0A8J5HSP1_ZINOF|nr:hypothetical protein ZIOFF_014040 [Zingiber officinale]
MTDSVSALTQVEKGAKELNDEGVRVELIYRGRWRRATVVEEEVRCNERRYGDMGDRSQSRKNIVSSFGFVDYFDRRSAALAIMTLNGRQLFGQPIKVNWAYASGQREDTSGQYNIFVGDLSPEITDATLFACFSVYPSCSDARVMWDQKTGRSRGFGFVSFRNQQDAQGAINDLTVIVVFIVDLKIVVMLIAQITMLKFMEFALIMFLTCTFHSAVLCVDVGKWLGSRQIRCNWATKGANANEEKQSSDSKSVLELTNGSTAEDVQENANDDGPENNPQYTTVYVGNLAHEVTQVDLHRYFHALGAGAIEDVRIQREKGFGFVRYSNHSEAALSIQLGNGRVFCGKPIKCSWGSKPTPPGIASTPLPPPAAAPFPGLSTADLFGYDRVLALSKLGANQALMQAPGQLPMKQAAMGLGAGASQALYDGGYQNAGAAQQLMYY